MKKALYLPGPSFWDAEVRKAAGWVRILDLQRDAIELAGYEVEVAKPQPPIYQESPPIAKYLSYGLPYAERAHGGEFDLIVGAPAYGALPILSAHPKTKTMVYIWNNSSAFRRAQLKDEYEFFGRPYPEDITSEELNTVVLHRCDRVIACSPFVAKTHAPICGAEKISIAPWGFDTETFKPRLEPLVSIQLEVLFVGGDPIRKGLPYLFAALDKLDGVRLTIAGCDVEPPPAVAKKCRVIGPVPHAQMPLVMQEANVICIPTLEDGVCVAITEGMSSGLVPVTSPDAGESFSIGDGFVCGFRDVPAIIKSLEMLRDNPAMLRGMAINARNHAEMATWEAFKRRFAQIIKEAV